MTYKCTQEVPKARNPQPNQIETDGQGKYFGRRPERAYREHNQKGRDRFSLDLPMLVDETARDVKILSAIAALEKEQPEDIFYPYRQHRSHLTTRFGLLFYNNKIIIPENMRTTVIAMLRQGHPSATKMDQLARAFWWPGIYQEI